MKALGALVLLLALAACSGSDGGLRAATPSSPSVPSPSAPSEAPSEVPSGDPAPDLPSEGPTTDLAATDVCDQVRQGIDQFNRGDLEATVAEFEKAVPLAEALAQDEPSADTRTLLDAVRYYADLAPEDYVEAAATSPDFARFKDFTLTRCAYGGPSDLPEPTDTGIPA